MFLKPCRNCPHKDGCELKVKRLESLRGLGFTSANFKCEKRLFLLPPGQRIELELATADPRYTHDETHTATVMRSRKTRILVWLDDGEDRRRNPIAVSPDRVKPIAGRVKLCPECDQPRGTKPMEREDGGGTFACPKCLGLKPLDLDTPAPGG